MKKIGGLFGRPAYGPIYEHMLKVMDCLKALDAIIQSFIDGDYEKIERLMEETCKLEHDADIIKKGIRENDIIWFKVGHPQVPPRATVHQFLRSDEWAEVLQCDGIC